MGSPRVGRFLKSFLEVVRFVVTKYHAVGSHGDSIHDRLQQFWDHSDHFWDNFIHDRLQQIFKSFLRGVRALKYCKNL